VSWSALRKRNRELIARGLAERNYDVFLAEDTEQAIERMRESQVDVVILDSDFDAAEQGAAFVTREVQVLRPADRRRLFFVSLTSSKRTLDGHTAFLNSGNLVLVNRAELADLPKFLIARCATLTSYTKTSTSPSALRLSRGRNQSKNLSH